MGLWRTLCLQSNIEEVLSLSKTCAEWYFLTAEPFGLIIFMFHNLFLFRDMLVLQVNDLHYKSIDLHLQTQEMGIENERERTSSMLDCKHNVLHKPILLKMEKEIINL